MHIPFCRRRCFYCNFPIKVIGDRESTLRSETESYVNLLTQEIELCASERSNKEETLGTVYFGGGTPSLLLPEQVYKVLQCLDSKFGIETGAEVTLEMDPGTFDLSRLREFQAAGVNRVSMGVQSFDQTVLSSCGRAHSAQDVEQAVACMHSAGMENFSIDLISSLPGVSLEAWRSTLHRAAATGCSHVSVYDLQIEDKTAFGRWYSPGQFPLPSDSDSAAMYTVAVETLTSAGFEHYEVSNYARAGRRSRHNQKYWHCEDVAGFGMGAASYVNNIRASRPDNMTAYLSWLALAQNQQQLYSNAVAALPGSESGEMLDGIMLALRTSDGLDLAELRATHGAQVVEKTLAGVKKFAGLGLVELRRNPPPDCSPLSLRLTDPKGFLVSNDIISTIFAQF